MKAWLRPVTGRWSGFSSARRRRFQSSLASVVEEPDEALQLSSKRRPRLQALRERLKGEPSVRVDHFKPATAASNETFIPDDPLYLQSLVDRLPDPEPSMILTDTFARKHTYLRLSLSERCNLRCTYCMPEKGVPLQPQEHLLQTQELLQLASYFVAQGVTKFRLTGGEPTLRKNLIDVVSGLAELQPQQIGMTTNGVTLHRQLPELVEAGLTSVNLSLDTLDPDQFAQLTRRPAAYLDRVWQTLELCHEVIPEQTKINCVVMRGINDAQIAPFIKLSEQFPKLQVRFIEYMPFDANGWNWDKFISYKEMLEALPFELEAVPSPDPHDTTKWFRTDSGGRIGFITSMSSHFCAGCNRLRLTADGQIKVCLFDGTTEISLRDALRQGMSEADLSKLVHYAIQKKKFSLGGHSDPQDISEDSANNRPMTLIGG